MVCIIKENRIIFLQIQAKLIFYSFELKGLTNMKDH